MARCRRALHLVVVLAVAGACVSGPAATFEQGVEHQPGPGWIRLEAQPAIAEIDLTFVLIVPGDEDSSRSDTIAAGDPVAVSIITLPGVHAIRMNGTACQGRFPVEEDKETDVVVRITADGCATAVRGIHDMEEMRHP